MSDGRSRIAAATSGQRSCHPEVERSPKAPPEISHKEATSNIGQNNLRQPIAKERASQPRLHPKMAFKKEHNDCLAREKEHVPAEREKEPSDCGKEKPLAAALQSIPAVVPQRKLIHPKFRRSPPATLTIDIHSGPEERLVVQVTGLSSTERMRFMEIMNAMASIESVVGSSFRKQTDEIRRQEKETSFVPLVILVCAKTMLRFAEKLAAFSLLPQQDKEVLLKGSLTEILLLRSAKFFSRVDQCWIFGPGDSTVCLFACVLTNVLILPSRRLSQRLSRSMYCEWLETKSTTNTQNL